MLSSHFSETELGVLGVEQRLVDNAAFLCTTLLEPIRAFYARPVWIHDGYRDPGHNSRVGGKPTSFHLFSDGRAAADFSVPGISIKDTFDWIRLHSGLKFDKVILESNANGLPATVHIQIDRLNPPRRQAFTGSTGAGTVYTSVEVR
jgi:hypothetical protein